MFTKIQTRTKIIALTLVTSAFLLLPGAASARNPLADICTDGSVQTSDVCVDQAKNDQLFGAGSLFDRVLQTLIFVIGAAAVIMLIIGGLRYILSGGDPNSTSSARSTILHAVIGVVVAMSAQLILSFVLRRL
jgi:hypothetical protein